MTIMKSANYLPKDAKKLALFYNHAVSRRRVPPERDPKDLAPFTADQRAQQEYFERWIERLEPQIRAVLDAELEGGD